MNGPTPPSTTSSTIIAPLACAAAASEGKPRVRRQWSSEEKAGHLALFAESGLTQAQYCEEMGLSAATFSLWRRQSRETGVASTQAASGHPFAQVLVAEPTAGASTPLPAPPVVIHLGGDTKLEVAVGTDPLWLASLLKTLRGA
ncbi:MAG: IS66 family insertion sequence element accessory protein TnpA [Geminicoccales bacterium]